MLRSRQDWVYEDAAHLLCQRDPFLKYRSVLVAEDVFLPYAPQPYLRVSHQVIQDHADCLAEPIHLPFEPHSLDQLVLAFLVLDHAMLIHFIQEANLVLKPQGRLIVIGWNRYWKNAMPLLKVKYQIGVSNFFHVEKHVFFCFCQRFACLDHFLESCFPAVGAAYYLEARKIELPRAASPLFDLRVPLARPTM